MHQGISGEVLPILLFLLKRPNSTTSPYYFQSVLQAKLCVVTVGYNVRQTLQRFIH